MSGVEHQMYIHVCILEFQIEIQQVIMTPTSKI